MATPQQVAYAQGVVIAELVAERDQALLRAAQAEQAIAELRAAAEADTDEPAEPPTAPARAPRKRT